MKRMNKKTIAFMMSVILVMSSLTGCKASENNAETVLPEDSGETESTAESIGHSSESGREETVYVIADASGKTKKTIVSTWLKNPEGAAVLEDRADLTDIKSVKGDGIYSENGNGSLEWQTNGDDVYYQGESAEALPVETTISYELDGRKVSADELNGASGHLVMTFDYENKTGTEKVINGEKTTIYQPFAVVTGMVVDNEKIANVKVTNGKVVNSGDQSVIVGMAMPGLKESLGLNDKEDDDLDVDIPESVTVEADITDFSLMTTITVMDNSLL